MYIREILNNFGEFWGTLGSFGELFFGELQETWGTFPKFPKIPQKFPKKIIFYDCRYCFLFFSFILYIYISIRALYSILTKLSSKHNYLWIAPSNDKWWYKSWTKCNAKNQIVRHNLQLYWVKYQLIIIHITKLWKHTSDRFPISP